MDFDADDSPPKHRKRSTRKRFIVRWRYQGVKPPSEDRLRRMLVSDWTERFVTLRAAEQAREDWLRGRGTWGALRRPPTWAATVEGPGVSAPADSAAGD